MCLSECCKCGPNSLYKAVSTIAIMDLVASVIFVSYETRNFGILTGLISYDKNCTNCTELADYVPKGFRFDFTTMTVMSVILLVFAGFIIEGFFYSKLKIGKRAKIHLFCKKWFEGRLVLLAITVLMAVAKVYRGFYRVEIDGVIDGITKTYRVITLYIVKCFMQELAETVGIEYKKPPKPKKRGSLSLKP